MEANEEKGRRRFKYLLIIPLTLIMAVISAGVRAQGPPPPPPTPGEVLNSINPFKKSGKRKSTRRKAKYNNNRSGAPAGPLPPPPDPLHLTRKVPAPPRP